jgi:hypothetical protein
VTSSSKYCWRLRLRVPAFRGSTLARFGRLRLAPARFGQPTETAARCIASPGTGLARHRRCAKRIARAKGGQGGRDPDALSCSQPVWAAHLASGYARGRDVEVIDVL